MKRGLGDGTMAEQAGSIRTPAFGDQVVSASSTTLFLSCNPYTLIKWGAPANLRISRLGVCIWNLILSAGFIT